MGVKQSGDDVVDVGALAFGKEIEPGVNLASDGHARVASYPAVVDRDAFGGRSIRSERILVFNLHDGKAAISMPTRLWKPATGDLFL
ncbi:hypothetical protein [Alkalidesulfovibrio alkalitolerans]|uniref:hypothetical protein n=1 Tax=Alkalidesulfovibrio alkalitolerans TaxID=293256 RepID=UPI00139F2972|nr:hypothetical protein [Alkalidesulfovibrio alkalitolerans]